MSYLDRLLIMFPFMASRSFYEAAFSFHICHTRLLAPALEIFFLGHKFMVLHGRLMSNFQDYLI